MQNIAFFFEVQHKSHDHQKVQWFTNQKNNLSTFPISKLLCLFLLSFDRFQDSSGPSGPPDPLLTRIGHGSREAKCLEGTLSPKSSPQTDVCLPQIEIFQRTRTASMCFGNQLDPSTDGHQPCASLFFFGNKTATTNAHPVCSPC